MRITPQKVAAVLRAAGFDAAKHHVNTRGVKTVARPGYRVVSTYADRQMMSGRVLSSERVITDIWIGWIPHGSDDDTAAELEALRIALRNAGVPAERSGANLRVPALIGRA